MVQLLLILHGRCRPTPPCEKCLTIAIAGIGLRSPLPGSSSTLEVASLRVTDFSRLIWRNDPHHCCIEKSSRAWSRDPLSVRGGFRNLSTCVDVTMAPTLATHRGPKRLASYHFETAVVKPVIHPDTLLKLSRASDRHCIASGPVFTRTPSILPRSLLIHM